MRNKGSKANFEMYWKAGALAGAALALTLAARQGSARAWIGATAVAVPLAARSFMGDWPMKARSNPGQVSAHVSLTIFRPREEVWARWRQLERLPEIMRHIKEVQERGDGRSYWRVATPVGDVEWEAEIQEERSPEVLRWASLPGSEIMHRGEVRFHRWKGDEGTRLDVRLQMGRPPGRESTSSATAVRTALAGLMRPALEREIAEDLRQFKARMETGEVPTTTGQSAGARKRGAS